MGYPVDQCATSPARQAMASTALRAFFGTGSDGFHASATVSHAEAGPLPRPVSLRADAGGEGNSKPAIRL